jgi:hypothetical protein
VIRRLRWVASLTALIVVAGAGPAWAHGIGGRVDLPVPRWLFIYGAAAAVVVSFVALIFLWRSPKLEGQPRQRPLPEPLQRILTGPIPDVIVRALSVLVFVVVTVAALAGSNSARLNLAPVFVLVWFWVGLAMAHVLLGNLWATLSPWDTLARALDLGSRPVRPYPKAWGKWPATILLLAFVWMELVYPNPSSPRSLGVAIVVYTAITLTGMTVFGREAWNRGGEAFAVYFELLSRIAPLTRDETGRVVVRPLLGGLPSLRPEPGLVPFVVSLIGTTTYDGFARSSLWVDRVRSLSQSGQVVAGTIGLLAMVGLVAGAYAISMGAAAAVAKADWRPLSVKFVHTLVPIAFAYVLAHYFSLLVLEGQLGVAVASDPLGSGLDLFGTASWAANLALVSATTIWYVQVAAIVGGHVGGVILAHDRAVSLFQPPKATRTQYALLGVMVLFTVGGLIILSGG